MGRSSVFCTMDGPEGRVSPSTARTTWHRTAGPYGKNPSTWMTHRMRFRGGPRLHPIFRAVVGVSRNPSCSRWAVLARTSPFCPVYCTKDGLGARLLHEGWAGGAFSARRMGRRGVWARLLHEGRTPERAAPSTPPRQHVVRGTAGAGAYFQRSMIRTSALASRLRRVETDSPTTACGSPSTFSMKAPPRESMVKEPATCSGSPVAM